MKKLKIILGCLAGVLSFGSTLKYELDRAKDAAYRKGYNDATSRYNEQLQQLRSDYNELKFKITTETES